MRRVVVTGLGMVTPLGCGVEPTWTQILAGKSGAKKTVSRARSKATSAALKKEGHSAASPKALSKHRFRLVIRVDLRSYSRSIAATNSTGAR